jgi:hypothetical protein
VDSQHHGAEDDGHQYNMPVPCNASDPKAALAVKTSPSKWTRSITALKMVVVDVACKYHATHQIQRLHLQFKKAIKVGRSITAPKMMTVNVTCQCHATR